MNKPILFWQLKRISTQLSPIVCLTDQLCFYTDTSLVLKFGIKVFLHTVNFLIMLSMCVAQWLLV